MIYQLMEGGFFTMRGLKLKNGVVLRLILSVSIWYLADGKEKQVVTEHVV